MRKNSPVGMPKRNLSKRKVLNSLSRTVGNTPSKTAEMKVRAPVLPRPRRVPRRAQYCSVQLLPQ